MKLSPKFEEALIYATRVHGGQLRKKTRIPYIGHLLGVAAIAMEYGANETEAIGALLHDAVEDCGGPARQREIEEMFGKEVGEIVAGCTDTDQTPKPPCRKGRKNTSRTWKRRRLRPGWSPPPTSCTMRGRSWTICAKMAMRSGRDLMAARRGRFGITAR